MRVLMISLDKKILERDSAVQTRHFEYGEICSELHILVLGNANLRKCESPPERLKFHKNDFVGLAFSLAGDLARISPVIKDNVRIYASGGKNKISRFFKACAMAGEIVKDHKIELVTTQDAAYTGLIGYCLKKKFKVKLNAQIHGMEEKFLNRILFLSLKRKIIKSADSIRVVSERMKRLMMAKYGVSEDKIFKIPIYAKIESGIMNHELGLNTPPLASSGQALAPLKRGNNGTDFTILTVGRLVKVKNIGLQIKAMADVVKIFPDTKLVIVGDGTEKSRLQKLAKKLKLNKKVEFKGWDNDISPYYENADLFLLTSDNEGWGMAVIEAMALGLTVIMTDVGCAGEVVKNGENGIVIHIGDKKALVAAVCNMIMNKEKREIFSEKGRETVAKLPNKEKTFEIYKKMWGN